jgi:hypothetical protein
MAFLMAAADATLTATHKQAQEGKRLVTGIADGSIPVSELAAESNMSAFIELANMSYVNLGLKVAQTSLKPAAISPIDGILADIEAKDSTQSMAFFNSQARDSSGAEPKAGN